MPWVVHEVVPLPDPVAQAEHVLGDRLNIMIGHFLAGHPNSRIGATLEVVGSERPTVRWHLQELGVTDIGPRTRRACYTIDDTRSGRMDDVGAEHSFEKFHDGLLVIGWFQ